MARIDALTEEPMHRRTFAVGCGARRGGVNGLTGEVLETHIRFHLPDGAKEQIAPELAEDLIDLVRAYLK
jgi:DNA-binding FrmR family transcriptional regulator